MNTLLFAYEPERDCVVVCLGREMVEDHLTVLGVKRLADFFRAVKIQKIDITVDQKSGWTTLRVPCKAHEAKHLIPVVRSTLARAGIT